MGAHLKFDFLEENNYIFQISKLHKTVNFA